MKLKVGDKVSLVGIVSQTAAGYRLLPRGPEDLTRDTTTPLADGGAYEAQAMTISETKSEHRSVQTYLWIALAALTALGGGLMIQYYLGNRPGGIAR